MSAVIITNMVVPESCCECPICHPKGKDEPWNYACYQVMMDINLNEWDTKRHPECPIKSTEGLIEKITQLPTQENAEGQDMFQAYDVIRAIREYCEVKE